MTEIVEKKVNTAVTPTKTAMSGCILSGIKSWDDIVKDQLLTTQNTEQEQEKEISTEGL